MKQATHRILNDCVYFKAGEEVYLEASEVSAFGEYHKWQSVNPSLGDGHWWMSDLSNVEEIVNQLEND
ncbi:hypothetical protein [Erwinia phage Pecta]|nr:hypothetical protein [Erwinia phage Pecta]